MGPTPFVDRDRVGVNVVPTQQTSAVRACVGLCFCLRFVSVCIVPVVETEGIIAWSAVADVVVVSV